MTLWLFTSSMFSNIFNILPNSLPMLFTFFQKNIGFSCGNTSTNFFCLGRHGDNCIRCCLRTSYEHQQFKLHGQCHGLTLCIWPGALFGGQLCFCVQFWWQFWSGGWATVWAECRWGWSLDKFWKCCLHWRGGDRRIWTPYSGAAATAAWEQGRCWNWMRTLWCMWVSKLEMNLIRKLTKATYLDR